MVTPGGKQSVPIINESGLYSLALSCATGVAKSLGYANPQKEVRDHCKGSVIRRLPTNGGEQAMKFIPRVTFTVWQPSQNLKDLLRDICGYIEILEKSDEISQRKIAPPKGKKSYTVQPMTQ